MSDAKTAALVIVNDIRRGLYLDSVALMRMSRTVAAMDRVAECGMMMGTPANLGIMTDAGVLADSGRNAAPGDLVIAISAQDQAAADAALSAARVLLDAPKGGAGKTSTWAPRTIRAAVAADPAANVALISVPGAFAAAEARKALQRGLNVMMFSDNVPVADEVELKLLAREHGLLMMGPDCGTAIINGTPLGFANVVPRGNIGIIGASGTGIQEVSCLIANNGGGISHAIGTGGRDLKAEVGGVTTLMAIDLLDADPATERIVIISKPPAAEVAEKILERVANSKKPFTICFLGSEKLRGAATITQAHTLKSCAEKALGKAFPNTHIDTHTIQRYRRNKGHNIRGLFAGGTLCSEAQIVFQRKGITAISNVPVPGAVRYAGHSDGHVLLDLGADEYTQGRPHPMIEPAVRDAAFMEAMADPAVGAILFDVVLGSGGHADPAGHVLKLVQAAREAQPTPNRPTPMLIASITGTRDDAQGWHQKMEKLSTIAVVRPSNADAAETAMMFMGLQNSPALSDA